MLSDGWKLQHQNFVELVVSVVSNFFEIKAIHLNMERLFFFETRQI